MREPGRILVTPRSLTREPHPAVDLLREAGYEVVSAPAGRQPSEEELLDLLPGCVGYLAGVEPITARVLAAAEGLLAISRNGVGTDNIDREAAEVAGIRILTTPGANAEGVAELALGLILALVRSIPAGDRAIKDGEWSRRIGAELQGATLGVVGCGNIGRRVALMALGIGMHVLGYDPVPADGFQPAGFEWAELDELLERSLVVTLHSPAVGRPIVDAAALTRMQTGSYLVNTARSSLVETGAVLEALDGGRLAGYAVDAYDEEPPVDRRLVEHVGVVATPHVGGYTTESVSRAALEAARNLLSVLQEEHDG